jgi:hypothetical protein
MLKKNNDASKADKGKNKKKKQVRPSVRKQKEEEEVKHVNPRYKSLNRWIDKLENY